MFQRLLALFTGEIAVIADVAIGAIRRHVVIDGIKAGGHANHYRHDRQRVEEGGKEGGGGQNASDSSVFERMLSSSLVKTNSSSCFIK